MPVIVIASSKGGAGKSTTAILLGTELARRGVEITMLDCDPNHSLTIWANRGNIPDNINTISDITEEKIIKTIKNYDSDGHIVIVDLEGVASRLVSRAISQADLVLIPMRATVLDGTIGARTIKLIAEEEEVLNRKIFHSVVFTMTRAIKTKQQNGIENSLRDAGIDIINPPLMERSAFSAIFEYGGSLHSMPSRQGNMEGAIENAAAFAAAVYKRLTEALR